MNIEAFNRQAGEIDEWFELLSPSERTTILCSLLQHCTSLEVRFLSTVLDEIACRDYYRLRQQELLANSPEYLGELEKEILLFSAGSSSTSSSEPQHQPVSSLSNGNGSHVSSSSSGSGSALGGSGRILHAKRLAHALLELVPLLHVRNYPASAKYMTMIQAIFPLTVDHSHVLQGQQQQQQQQSSHAPSTTATASSPSDSSSAPSGIGTTTTTTSSSSSSDPSYSFDFCNDCRTLLTMVLTHPSFTFHQKEVAMGLLQRLMFLSGTQSELDPDQDEEDDPLDASTHHSQAHTDASSTSASTTSSNTNLATSDPSSLQPKPAFVAKLNKKQSNAMRHSHPSAMKRPRSFMDDPSSMIGFLQFLKPNFTTSFSSIDASAPAASSPTNSSPAPGTKSDATSPTQQSGAAGLAPDDGLFITADRLKHYSEQKQQQHLLQSQRPAPSVPASAAGKPKPSIIPRNSSASSLTNVPSGSPHDARPVSFPSSFSSNMPTPPSPSLLSTSLSPDGSGTLKPVRQAPPVPLTSPASSSGPKSPVSTPTTNTALLPPLAVAALAQAGSVPPPKPPKPAKATLYPNIDIPLWLRGLRLHKYNHLFEGMTVEEMLLLSEDQLKAWGMTNGATKKLALNLQEIQKASASLGSDRRSRLSVFPTESPESTLPGSTASPVYASTLDRRHADEEEHIYDQVYTDGGESLRTTSSGANEHSEMDPAIVRAALKGAPPTSPLKLAAPDKTPAPASGAKAPANPTTTMAATTTTMAAAVPAPQKPPKLRTSVVVVSGQPSASPTTFAAASNNKSFCFNCGLEGHNGYECGAPHIDSMVHQMLPHVYNEEEEESRTGK